MLESSRNISGITFFLDCYANIDILKRMKILYIEMAHWASAFIYESFIEIRVDHFCIFPDIERWLQVRVLHGVRGWRLRQGVYVACLRRSTKPGRTKTLVDDFTGVFASRFVARLNIFGLV